MPLLPSRSSTRRRRRRAVPAPSGPGRSLFRKAGLRLCSSAPRGARRPMCGASAATSRIGAASRDKPRRVVAEVERHPGDLFLKIGFPKIGFVVTNPPMEPDRIIRFYNQRGTAERHVEAGRRSIGRVFPARAWRGTRCGFSFMHRPAIPVSCCRAPICRRRRPTGLRTRLIRIGARIVRHAPIHHVPTGRGGCRRRSVHPHPCGHPTAPCAPGTGMTVSAIKPGGKWLDGSDPAGAVQTDFQFKPVAAAINRARSRTGCPNHDTACPRGLIRTQYSGSMIETAF